ncbi:MAG TPA: group I intron-associated PD-(D/E)XK endonuclease [Egibacteraceae bacterium]|nr:group I intron-associated PD-(D/E)XK endonuclease [Egibacteraceae bacterium]
MTSTTSTIRRRNPRLQGEIGLGAAIAWFTSEGYSVSIPLCDNQPYDLVVEDRASGDLLRVQVKTSTGKNASGTFVVRLFTAGGNQSFHTRKLFDNTASDLLFVLTDDREIYVIPCREIPNRNLIALGAKWRQYRKSSS